MAKWVNREIWRVWSGAIAAVILAMAVAGGCVSPATAPPPPGGATVPPAQQAPSSYREVPRPAPSGGCSEFVITPQETAAAVGSEVILVASVRGQDQYMLTNQRVEWTIAPGGVGNFVDFRRAGFMDYLVGDFTRPRKVTEQYVITSTSREYIRLNRGTITPADDVIVQPGQAWVSLTSPVEGTTVVNVYVPCVHSWERRVQSAFIHWVDAQWTLPPPTILPAGARHKLTTTVVRQRDRSPCAGWKVRYEIIGGVSAVFGPDGTSSVEVPVDSSGQAAAEIFQPQPLGGSTQVAVQIIRPADAPGASGRQLIVGSGITMVTWSAAQLALRVNAPSSVAVGGSTTVRIEVNNPGDLPAENVLVNMNLPAGVTQQSTTPAASVSGTMLSWNLGRLNPKEMRTLDATLQFAQQGSYTLCAQAQAAGGLQAQNCASVSAGMVQLELRVEGPERAQVGQEVTYVIQITNRGASPLSQLLVRDTFDPGLQHAVAQRAVERDLPGTLQPGETKTIGVVFRVVQPGRWCHTVQVTGAGGIVASQTTCLQAETVPSAAATSPPTTPTPQPAIPAPATPPSQPSPAAPSAPSGQPQPSPTPPSTGQPLPPTPFQQPSPTPSAGVTPSPGTGVPPPGTPAPGSVGAPAPSGTTGGPGAAPAVPGTPSGTAPGTPGGSSGGTYPATPGGPTAGTSPTAPGLPGAAAGQTPAGSPAPSGGAVSGLTLTVSGPNTVKLGESATFTLEVANTTAVRVSNIQLKCTFDVAFEPLRASAGYLLEGDAIVWNLASIEPNQPLRRQIELRAVAVAENACCRGTLTTATGQGPVQVACVRIEPASAGPTVRERPTTPPEKTPSSPQSPPASSAQTSADTLASQPAGVEKTASSSLAQSLPGTSATAREGQLPAGGVQSGPATGVAGQAAGNPGIPPHTQSAEGQPRAESAGAASPDTNKGTAPAHQNSLRAWFIDRHEPIAVGKSKTVTLQVHNPGPNPVRNVRVTIRIPQDFSLAADGIKAPVAVERTNPGLLECAPLQALQPGQTMSVAIPLIAKEPGSVTLTARIAWDGGPLETLQIVRTTAIVP